MLPNERSCFAELLRTGRSLATVEKQAAVANATQLIFAPNPRRVRLYIGAITANRISINFDKAAVDTQGIVISSSWINSPIKIEDLGLLLCGSINAICNVAGPQQIWFAEVSLMDNV